MHDNTFIGLDVHKATISVAIAQGERGGEVRHYGTISHRPDHVRKLVEKRSGTCTRSCACPRGFSMLRGSRRT
jgi:transposase